MCPIHVLAFMSQHPCVSQNPLQDPCLRIHISAAICISGSSTRSASSTHVSASLYLTDSLQDPCLRTHVSASLYLRILCRIHISGSVCKHPNVSQDPLQDPCLQIHVSDSCLSIHQNGSSRRSTSSDSCPSIFVSHGFSTRPMSPDPCRSIHLYFKILCKIHVSGVMSQHLCISGSSAGSMSPDPCLSIFISQELLQNPCLRFMSWHPYHPILWPCAGKTVRPSVSRRRNANFDLPRRIFGGPAQAKRNFWPRESRFLWPCAGKNEQDQNLHLDLGGFTPTVRTPQCATLFGEKWWLAEWSMEWPLCRITWLLHVTTINK